MRNPVEDTFLSVRICVLPKVAWWGKGKVDTLDGHSIDSTASDYCLLTKSASDCIVEDSCGFKE